MRADDHLSNVWYLSKRHESTRIGERLYAVSEQRQNQSAYLARGIADYASKPRTPPVVDMGLSENGLKNFDGGWAKKEIRSEKQGRCPPGGGCFGKWISH